MLPEIEKLIELALADGQVTVRERNVILKKAKSLGVDEDEVEMILDGRIHQLQSSQIKVSKEKVGNIQTCPACGGSVKAMEIICTDCGHEFQNKNVNKSIKNLIEKLEKEDNKNYDFDGDRSEKKAKIISQFPISQTKDDILEFLSYSFPFLENTSLDRDEKKAWKIKVGQALMKAKISFENNSSYKDLLKEYEIKMDFISKNEKKAERNDNILGIFLLPFLLFVVYLMYAFFASWFGAKYWPFN
jgi:hypothetical protein